MKLYICGNGFDLYHGYKTGYRDYRKFLLEHHSHAFKAFDDFQYLDLSSSDKWSDLEQSLTIDYEECIDDAINEYYPDLNDDSESRWYGIDVDLEEQTKFIFDFTGRFFLEWLTQINFSNPINTIPIDKNGLFITFNYTNTLEELYAIDPDKILHIHGHVDLVDGRNMLDWFIPSFTTMEEAENAEQVRVDLINSDTVRKQIQFGSVDNDIALIKKEMMEKYGDDEFYTVSIEPGVNHIIDFCEAASKNVQQNYAQLRTFIENNDINEVVVMGHSIMGIDLPYYSDVIVPALNGCQWNFYWYSDEDRDDIELFIRQFSLKNYTMVKW